jgi:hypothetical protein
MAHLVIAKHIKSSTRNYRYFDRFSSIFDRKVTQFVGKMLIYPQKKKNWVGRPRGFQKWILLFFYLIF